ncbi:putative rosmarinate synthase [Arabidopsis thaliana]|jgi:hypothetical protein|uniref:At5g02890 n=4 Tax=Arabidopsis TaxID=3701 RepID=Q9LYZ6_ARATH|nr:HXXXD-type acyl-transferase family protein [Arabidopsis thaliana]KAG7600957.1 Transferase [Arabidopsis thaliana x Arabidopsis arenosa]AAO00899.1 putative protein [Arabidopsis thaliana]AAQ56813.1 At5g02890 [Arabidopsis thaliana]AED90532.1 HXXXD-type acyl-transferase family protein [Arabidopsis thaliana]OAO92574.1 hypothetical protein AXX17_AT5G02060 [Arabidopsis thaliana]|eukprot:NP_195909.1 HXXXD-type acyl-transferase family protein [Arabidopsis thaliana]
METKIPKSMIAGVQTVMPVEVTQHREIRSVSVVDPVGVGIFRRTVNIVTYYKEAGDSGGERGWLVAGWIKESLGRALTEQPMLSGRLRRRKTAGNDGLELVANDSGVRMVEAKFPASLPEFLEMAKRDKSRAEAETVFWKDIDEDEPQYSPLFYVQVTNFESGGYSIGISCSILIADLFLETGFLTKWAQIQSSLAQTTLKPVFHLPSLKQDFGNFLTEFFRSASVLDRGEPIAFRAKTCLKISPACIVTSKRTSGDVFLFIKEQSSGENSTGCDGTKVEIHSSDEVIKGCDCGRDSEETNDGVLDKSLSFGERLEVTSCWVGCVSKGVVFVFPSTFGDAKSLAKFIVALPKE